MAADRGRLTVPDIPYILATLVVLAALAPPFYEMLEANAFRMDTGTVYLAQLLVPLAVLVFLSLIYVAAVGGER